MRGLHFLVLALNQPACFFVQIAFGQSFAVIFNGGIFSAFTLDEDGVRFMRSEGGFQVHPAAVQRASYAAPFIGIAAKEADSLLKFADELGALHGVIVEDAGEFRVFAVARRVLVAVLAVSANLD